MKRSILLFVPILLIFIISFSQNIFSDIRSAEKLRLQLAMDAEKSAIKNSNHFSSLNKYLSLRRENISLCNDAGCRQAVENLLPFRYMGEGRCGEINNSGQREMCLALKRGSCSGLIEPMNRFCQAIMNKDANLLSEIAASRDFSRVAGDVMSSDDVREILGVYYGFKEHSIIACERFLSDKRLSLSVQLSCPILFAKDPEQQINNILEDLAFFNLSRENNNSDLCESIRNYLIKNRCKDTKVKNLSDMW